MKTQHTPKPWSLAFYGDALACAVVHGETSICRMAMPNDLHRAPKQSEAEANAHLIASAPELLEALRAAEKWAMLTQTDPVPWLDDAISAIAKATQDNT
jgi:hypothetical protein